MASSLVDIDMDLNDLTPLTWLQNINILESPPMTPPESETETPPPIDYRTNSTKPPHSYSKLITMALTSNSKMTLSQIYSWIRDNFSYYQNADSSWKNSIRHNLSLNKCFVKIARAKGEPGKGGFWKLDESVLHEKRTRRTKTKRNKPEQKEPLEELVVEEFIEFQWDSVFEIELEDLMGSTISVPTSDNNILVETTTLVK